MSAVTAAMSESNQANAVARKFRLSLKIARLAKRTRDSYYDCCIGVSGMGMLVEEANERATKPWCQRLPED